jgi:hypothetical protein
MAKPGCRPYLFGEILFPFLKEPTRLIDRRQFMIATGALGLAGPARAAGLPIPPGNAIAFKVFRNGSPIGEHRLTFTRNGDDLTVDINIDLTVRLAGIPVYRYSLTGNTKYSGGVFTSADTVTNNNGEHLEMHCRKVAAGYDVVGVNHNDPSKSFPEYTAPPNTLPLTYWDKRMLYANILNIQTAHSYPATVTPAGWFKMPTADGGSIVAQRFDLTGKLQLSVWYDQNDQWASLEFHFSGDETYQKLTS